MQEAGKKNSGKLNSETASLEQRTEKVAQEMLGLVCELQNLQYLRDMLCKELSAFDRRFSALGQRWEVLMGQLEKTLRDQMTH